MTAPTTGRPAPFDAAAPEAPAIPSAIAACLARLDAAIDAAAELGLDVADAAAVRDAGRQRLRFPGETYVLALAGGTGVGKSSLLNALAGRAVSEAGVRRPTTDAPVAWVDRRARTEMQPLLEWLGITEVREHDSPTIADVAIVDLPDLDSIAVDHRAQVDALLPRVDAVAWVSDPEKYADRLLHDDYLRAWVPRLARQVMVLNKRDRLGPGDQERVRADLRQRLRSEGLPDLEVLLTSAHDDSAAELRHWLASAAEAKAVVAARIAADGGASVEALAVRAGVRGSSDATLEPLVSAERRRQAIDAIVGEALRLLDLDGLEHQAVAATRQASRPRGGGPIGQVTSRLHRWSGRSAAVADPAGFLRRWRERGSLVRTAAPLRDVVGEVLPKVPPAARPAIAALADGTAARARLSNAIDRAVTSPAADFHPPTSVLWPFVGAAQYVATGGIVLGVIWLLAAWLGAGVPSTVTLPILGAVPMPVVLIAAGLVAGVVLGRVVALHAALIGRRWAGRLRRTISAELAAGLGDAFGPLDRIEAARVRLGEAAADAARECRPGVR